MNILVDTTIWSHVLRKKTVPKRESIEEARLTDIINEGRAKIIGPIRQEILSGISQSATYKQLQQKLAAFEDIPIFSEDYERAAEMFNMCCKKGIQGSHIDFLICAVAEQHGLLIFTLDKDFVRYATVLPIKLY